MSKQKKKNGQKIKLAVDVILYDVDSESVLLVKRNIKPFKGRWVLPGGHVEYGETTEQAAIREMEEELHIKIKLEGLVGVYSNPKRDPRGHMVSAAYFASTKQSDAIRLNFEATRYQWFQFNKFLKRDKLPKKIGFDHRDILNDFKKVFKGKKIIERFQTEWQQNMNLYALTFRHR
ncbi:MAG: NUDIX hydrolase [Parcubacteria group bacterium]|nr:NUDIX hydrolase [Parcubacteria group bacterium]